MSGGQKQNVMTKTSEQEKAVLVTEEKTGNSSSSSSEGETTDSETGKLSQLNFGGRIHGELLYSFAFVISHLSDYDVNRNILCLT